MDLIQKIIVLAFGIVFFIGFLRIFSIDESLRKIVRLLEKQGQDADKRL